MKDTKLITLGEFIRIFETVLKKKSRVAWELLVNVFILI